MCSNNNDLLKCLKNVKPIDLLKNCDENVLRVVDEPFYPIDSVQAVKSGKFNSDIKIMSRTTENEGTGLSEVQNIPTNSSGIHLMREIRMFTNEILKMNIRLKSQNYRNQILDFYLPLENQTKL